MPAQTGLADGAMEILTGSTGFTVIVTAPEAAGLPAAQVAFEVSSQVIISLFTGIYVYAALFEPASDPLTFHWYIGAVPPLKAVAVKVTEVPAQMVVAVAEMLTLTGRMGLTVMVTVLEVAGLPEVQVSLEVSTTVTASVLARVFVVNVGLLDPTSDPFTFHW